MAKKTKERFCGTCKWLVHCATHFPESNIGRTSPACANYDFMDAQKAFEEMLVNLNSLVDQRNELAQFEATARANIANHLWCHGLETDKGYTMEAKVVGHATMQHANWSEYVTDPGTWSWNEAWEKLIQELKEKFPEALYLEVDWVTHRQALIEHLIQLGDERFVFEEASMSVVNKLIEDKRISEETDKELFDLITQAKTPIRRDWRLTIRDGAKICPNCQTGNKAQAKFCSECAFEFQPK